MEILVSIVTIRDLEKVTWTAPDGRAMETTKRGLVLCDGSDQFYAEMYGKYAEEWQAPLPNVWLKLKATLRLKSWQDREQRTRYMTDVIINQLGKGGARCIYRYWLTRRLPTASRMGSVW